MKYHDKTQYAVVCLDDNPHGYTLATRSIFVSHQEAIEYAATVHPDRKPLVVEGQFFNLREKGEA